MLVDVALQDRYQSPFIKSLHNGAKQLKFY